MDNTNALMPRPMRRLGTNLSRRRFLTRSAAIATAVGLPGAAVGAAGASTRSASEFRLSCTPNPSSDILTFFRARELVFDAVKNPSRAPCLDLGQYRTVSDEAWAELEKVSWVLATIGVGDLSPKALDWIQSQFNCFIEFIHLENISPAELLFLCQLECAMFRNVHLLTSAVIDFVGDKSRWIGGDGTQGAGYFSFSGNFEIGRDFAAAVSRSPASLDFQTATLDSFLTAENARLLALHPGEYLAFDDPRSRCDIYGLVDADPPVECPFDTAVLSIFRSTPGKCAKVIKPFTADQPWSLSLESHDNARIKRPA